MATTQHSTSKLIGQYIEECRNGGSGTRFALGALPGFPNWTDDPQMLDKALAVYEQKLDEPMGTIKELKLRQRIRDVKQGAAAMRAGRDGSKARDAFVTHGKTWAKANGISPATFREMGVPTDVLREAGIA